MKKLSLLVLVSLIACHKQTPQQVNAIVTLNENVQPIDSMTLVLDKTISEINASSRYDNFILFIHGRGKHPQKAFKKKLLIDLEKDYSAKVIMFHWPSWEGTYAFPTKKARNAAADLLQVFKMIEGYKINCKGKCKNINFTLFSNSMGSIVLEQAMLNYDGSISQIFDTLIINASSSLARNHSHWVDKINFSKNTYITINQDDKLLGKLGIRFLGKRLGKGLTSLFGNEFNTAKDVTYIDLTKSQIGHSYYLHRNIAGKPVVLNFYKQVLNGVAFTLGSNNL